jgi:hypothetical protein
MFGGMGGMGGRNSSLRFLRLGALAALLIGTAVFHVRGSGYVTLRVIYIVVIIGVLIASFALRHRGVRGLAVVLAVEVVGWGAGSEAAHSGAASTTNQISQEL